MYDGRGSVREEGKGRVKATKKIKKGDKLVMNVSLKEGLVKWLLEGEELVRHEDETLKDKSITWAPFIKMWDRGDSVEF